MDVNKKVIDAVTRGSIARLEEALREGGSANALDNGRSALRLAALSELPELMKVLISHGASVNERDDTGASILLDCSFIGNSDVVLALLQGGADVALSDDDGQTPLMAAEKAGHREILELLIKYGN